MVLLSEGYWVILKCCCRVFLYEPVLVTHVWICYLLLWFKDLTEVHLCWLGMIAEWQCQCFIHTNGLIWYCQRSYCKKHHRHYFIYLVDSVSILGPVGLFLPFRSLLVLEKKMMFLIVLSNVFHVWFQVFWSLRDFIPGDRVPDGKSVAETLQRVLFEMFHGGVFSHDWGQSDHQIWV